MIRVKKSHLFFGVATFTIVFIGVQVFLSSSLSILSFSGGIRSSDKNDENGNDLEKKSFIIAEENENELLPLNALTTLKRTIANENIYKKTRLVEEWYIPMIDSFKKGPLLRDLLFFFDPTSHMSKKYSLQKEKKLLPIPNLQTDVSKNNANPHIRGIRAQEFELYQPDTDKRFKCIRSNQHISYSNFNDDFCDCIDGTDEPGTSACSFGTFFCKNQNEYLKQISIPSSKVDDGVCDCCDGSDEKSDGSNSECKNVCDVAIESGKLQRAEQQRALKEKESYKMSGQMASQLAKKNRKEFGPQGVFYRLSKKCFQIDWSEFTFKVCPFKRVDQIKNNIKTDCGSSAKLITKNDKWMLRMSGGAKNFCGRPRESLIQFECYHQDLLKRVQEREKCVYEFVMMTPAAC